MGHPILSAYKSLRHSVFSKVVKRCKNSGTSRIIRLYNPWDTLSYQGVKKIWDTLYYQDVKKTWDTLQL